MLLFFFICLLALIIIIVVMLATYPLVSLALELDLVIGCSRRLIGWGGAHSVSEIILRCGGLTSALSNSRVFLATVTLRASCLLRRIELLSPSSASSSVIACSFFILPLLVAILRVEVIVPHVGSSPLAPYYLMATPRLIEAILVILVVRLILLLVQSTATLYLFIDGLLVLSCGGRLLHWAVVDGPPSSVGNRLLPLLLIFLIVQILLIWSGSCVWLWASAIWLGLLNLSNIFLVSVLLMLRSSIVVLRNSCASLVMTPSSCVSSTSWLIIVVVMIHCYLVVVIIIIIMS